MFRGEAWHQLDAKGRVIIAQKFREQLGEHFVITKALDDCLHIYPMDAWNEFEAKVSKLPSTDINVRRFIRKYIGGAFDAEIDAQGRTIVPQNLREYAGITKEVVLVGAIDKIELWSVENYKLDQAGLDDGNDDAMALKMAEYGI